MIDRIGSNPLSAISAAPASSGSSIGAADVSKGFGEFLNDALNNLNEQEKTVDELNKAFIKGDLSDVHQLTIASEQAQIALELTVQVRNKAVEAYQEIMRMQI
jgi:flagellar hook-basal body complex protein FliE